MPSIVYGSAEPTAISDIDTEFIIAYCIANNETEWLKGEIQKTYIDKNGKERKENIFQLRSAFVKKFYPTLTVKPPKQTLFDRIMAL